MTVVVATAVADDIKVTTYRVSIGLRLLSP